MQRPDWFEKLQPYAASDSLSVLYLILTSLVPYIVIVSFMFFLSISGYPPGIILFLAVIAAGFYIRMFMVLHDCSHTSFMKSKRICSILGHLLGVLTFTPFFDWQRNHGIHHASVSNLDKRGIGDVWTMTVKEYHSAKIHVRFLYRLFRNPFFLFSVAPTFLFFIMYRFPQKSTRRKDYFSILFTNIMLAIIIATAYFTIGLKHYFIVQLSILVIATTVGLWLFYVQHQFEDVYWAHTGEWDLISAAVKGSSFYKLPTLLRWVTGNIGYHNIHHLKPSIPCYNLKKCYDNVQELHYITPITIATSLKSLRLSLWDEETGKLISFREASKRRKQNEQSLVSGRVI